MYAPPAYPMSAELVPAPSGAVSVFYTLRQMRRLIAEYKTHPAILACAQSLIFLTPQKHGVAEIEAIFTHCRDWVRYTADVYGVETLANPVSTLNRRQGDCDDKTALFCALCEAVGYPTRLVMADYDGRGWAHVYCQVMIDGEWWDADTTENLPLGECPPGAVSLYIEGQ